MPQKLNKHQSVQQSQTNLEVMANAWELEKQWTHMEVEHAHKAQAPPTCTQPIQGKWVMGKR